MSFNIPVAPATKTVAPSALAVADGAGLSGLLVIHGTFAAGGGGAPDDVTLYSANAPFKFRIIDAWVHVSTLVALATVQLRSASGGAGSALSDAFVGSALGISRNLLLQTTSTVALAGSLFLRRSDSGVAGEVTLLVRPET